ncbi:hypothetical protein AB0K51_14660 [Kitasatospora sp. NPDC049285]|uniref:hypothetical protein n=1 Tax=Kitasatospora sp. NPDC049285 TaxID=3157096 RepID=UPI00342126D7
MSTAGLLTAATGTAHADSPVRLCGPTHAVNYNYTAQACLTMTGLEWGTPKFTRFASYRGGSTDIRMGFAVMEAPPSSPYSGWYISQSWPTGNLTTYQNGSYNGSISDGDPSNGTGGIGHTGHCYTAVTFFTESGVWHYGAQSKPICI